MKRSASTRYTGISKKTIVHRSQLGGRTSAILTSGRQNEREAAAQQKRHTAIQRLDEDDRQAVAQMYGSDSDVVAVANTVPLGEEGIETSHEGGEFEVFENLANDIASSTGYQRVDHCTRQDRTEVQTEHWLLQIDKLVNAYLSFRTNSEYDGQANQTVPVEPTTPPSVITIEVIDLFFRKTVSLPIAQAEIYPNETLLRNGYLSCSPLTPTVAITVHSLSAYRQTHRTCPHFSISAFSKMLCHLHNVPFHNYLQKQFAVAFDIYLEICRHVDKKLDEKLAYDTARGRLIQQCPPCFFKLEGEPDLDFSIMVSMDSNNSLKRIGASIRACHESFDSWSIDSARWLTPEEVDRFKDEVAERPERGIVRNPGDFHSDEAGLPAGTDGDLKCAKQWKNAGPKQRKCMFVLFEETGIFIAACRHRTILYACDMIKSGELAKYPLVIVNRMIDEVGHKIGCAYDIGCTFHKTLNNSSVGPCACASNFRLMVGAFHGYAHERACQLAWHPLYMKGTGHTEGEGSIDDHFKFWDQDKYALLSTFIVNHYEQAIKTIEELEDDLAGNKRDLGCEDSDFECHFMAEKEYLSNLEKPDPVIETKRDYVKSLHQLVRFRNEWESTHQTTINICRQLAATGDNTVVSQAKCQAEVSYGQVQNAEALVTLYEVMLGVSERWTETSAEYIQYYKENVKTSYWKAIDELERAVVMRIWELTKMKATGTGYKLRQHIAKALNRWSDAVKKAIKRYNDQAELLDPPAPSITWEEIAEYTFVGEFDLLRNTQADMQEEKWTQKAYHEAALKYYKLCRSWEEVQRLNIEVHRLQAFIHEETKHTESVIKQLTANDPLLAAEMRRRWTLRSSINVLHLQRLKQLECQPYFTGSQDLLGESIGSQGVFHLGTGNVLTHSLEQED